MMTVSRALNGTGRIAKSTRERILGIADNLGYRPNRLVRSIKGGASNLVGIVAPAHLGYFGRVLPSLYETLFRNNYSTLLGLVQGHAGEEAVRSEREQLHRLIEHRIDGLILWPVNDLATDLYFEEINKRKLPLVIVDRQLSRVHGDFVGTNDSLMGRLAADQLLKSRPRELLVISAGSHVLVSRRRAEGFVKRVARCSPRTVVHRLRQDTFTPCPETVATTLKTYPRISGIFCVNDAVAQGAIEAACQLGRPVPERIEVIGAGALSAETGRPLPISTFDQHPERVGQAAAETLLQRLHGDAPPTPSSVLIPPTFLPRGSTRD